MAPRPRWWHTLQSSKAEVLLAVDLYNRSGHERQLEAFIVHMNLGWTKLLQAHTEKTGGSLIVKDDRGRRRKHPEGGYLYKPLRELLTEQFPDNDPRRNNIVFFMGLRNQIEHRHESKVAALVAGRTQPSSSTTNRHSLSGSAKMRPLLRSCGSRSLSQRSPGTP